MRRVTIGDKIVELLDAQGEMTSGQIMEALDISHSSLYSAIHDFNKRKNGRKIFNHKFKYRVAGKKTNVPAIQEKIPPAKNLPINGLHLQSGLLKKLKSLSPSDLEDCLDMLKKSAFYNKSAVALIEVNESVAALRNTLMTEGEL
jgi:hypothetical protein